MKPCSPRCKGRSPRAASLIELCVCMGLVGLLMLCIGQIVQAASRYYTNSTKITDLQQACLLTATSLASELSEGNSRGISVEPHRGVVFCSPRNSEGGVSFVDRDMIWQKWITYYTIDGGDNGYRLIRKEEYLNEAIPVTAPTPVPSEKTIDYFRGETSNVGRQVARYIYDLDVTRTFPLKIAIGAQDELGEFRVVVQTKVKMRN